MNAIVTLSKPTLRMVKLGDVERPVIEVKMTLPYTEENWRFVGQKCGDSLDIVAVNAQREMFDEETGEIRTARR